MRNYFYLLSGIYFFLLFGSLSAQEYTLNTQNFNIENGLLHRSSGPVFEDKDGFIWIGNFKGLQRYDGREFKSWTKSNTNGLIDNITKIGQDNDGWLWLWNHDERFFVFLNPITLELLTAKERYGADFPIEMAVNYQGWIDSGGSMITDKLNRFYFLLSNPYQLIIFDGNKGWKKIDFPDFPVKGLDLETIDNQNNLWVHAYNEHLVFKVDTLGNILKKIDFLGKLVGINIFRYQDKLFCSGQDTGGIYSLFEIDETGDLNFVKKKNLHHYNVTRNFFYESQEEEVAIYQNDIIAPIITIDDSTLPFIESGAGRLDLYADSRDRIWEYSQFGVNLMKIHPERFKNYFSFEENAEKPINNSARGIWVENDKVFINFEFGGLVEFNEKAPENWNILSTIPSDGGILYMGRPVIKYDDKLLTGHHYEIREHTSMLGNYKAITPRVKETRFGSHDNFIWSFFEDKNETLWLGTNKGLSYFNKRDTFLNLIEPADLTYKEWMDFGIVHQITADKNNKIWLATSNGLYQFDPETKTYLAKYAKTEEADFYLPAQWFHWIYSDKNGIFWLGTRDGLIRWDKEKNEYRVFTTLDGLSNDVIYAIFEDSHNHLWMSSDYGIMQFNKENFQTRTYLEKDGLPHTEFNRTSAFQEKVPEGSKRSGTIYFGTLNGVTAFNPDDFYQDDKEKPYNLVITDFKIFDGNEGKLLDRVGDLRTTNTITFQPNDRFFRLKFELLTFDDVNRILFAWKVEGVDEGWNYQKENVLQIGKLPFGTHTLRVKAQSSGGQWSPNELAITINVLRPFYLKTWFILLSILMLALSAYLFYRRRTRLYKETQKLLQTEIAKATSKIAKQTEELKQLDEVKSRFFANVTHELRTPLTLMLGPISSVLKSSDLNNRNFTLLKRAQQGGKDLLKLIGAILDLSKMESGKIELHEKPELLFNLIRRIASFFESHAQREGIQFTLNYQAEKDLQLELDKDKIEIILNNLLSNAVKFTEKGGKLTIVVEDLENAIKIGVIDTGRGIHPNDLPHVFNRFYQSKQPDAPTEGGTGIGLALSQEFIHLMGGKIWVESKLGAGSAFYFEIPRKEVLGMVGEKGEELRVAGFEPLKGELASNLTSEAETKIRPPFRGLGSNPQPATRNPQLLETILIVEDNHSLRGYLKTILESHYEVLTAENGQVALDLLNSPPSPGEVLPSSPLKGEQSLVSTSEAKLEANSPFRGLGGKIDLILSDIMMPKMDGYQFLGHLKEDEVFRNIPIIMLTARADIQDKLKALRIGVDDYLLKPFEEEELLARIENLLKHYNQRKNYNPKSVIDKKSESKKSSPKISEADQEWLKSVEQFLKKQIANTQFSIPQMADEFAMSESTLQRQLKKIAGLTPAKYLQEIRLNQARTFLENRKYETISKVAYEVGFRDAKAFARSFKKRFGKTPSEYLQ